MFPCYSCPRIGMYRCAGLEPAGSLLRHHQSKSVISSLLGHQGGDVLAYRAPTCLSPIALQKIEVPRFPSWYSMRHRQVLQCGIALCPGVQDGIPSGYIWIKSGPQIGFRLSFINSGTRASSQIRLMDSIHSRCGWCRLLPGPVMEPTMIQPGTAGQFTMPVGNGSKIGSILKKVFMPRRQKKRCSGPVIVVPYQKFFSCGSFFLKAKS